MIHGNCPVCDAKISDGKNQAQYHRNLGLHLRAAHKYPKGKRVEVIRTARSRGFEDQPKKRKYTKRQQPDPAANFLMDQVALKECPCCHAVFYASRPRN